MSLESLCTDLEEVDGIELADTHPDEPKGVILGLTLEQDAEGNGEEVLKRVLDAIPRDFIGEHFDPDERVDIYYDAIEIKL